MLSDPSRLPNILGAAALLVALTLGGAAAAQEPVPQDTVRVPIPPEQVASDTIPTRTAEPDSLLPAPSLPVMPAAGAVGFGVATWEWRGAELERLRGVSLLDLLTRVPGLLQTREHGFGQPAGVAAFGLGGGRLRVFRDGFELDPLSASILHLQHIGIVDVDAVRVVRGLHETRIELTTYRPPTRQPHSVVEAGLGQPQLRLLRALFARPTGERTVALVGFDLVDTRGPLTGPASSLGYGVVRLTREFTAALGAEVEYRQQSTEFGGGAFAQDFSRRELLLRARAALAPGAVVEATLGRTWRRAGDRDSVGIVWRGLGPADTAAAELGVDQAVLRAAYASTGFWAEADARLRRGAARGCPTPDGDLSFRAGAAPLPLLQASVEVRAAGGDAGGTELGGTVQAGPFAGVSLFASLAAGARPVGVLQDAFALRPRADPLAAPDTVRGVVPRAVRSEHSALRAGGQWARGSAVLGAAWVRSDADVVVPFGWGFDAGTAVPDVRPATGVELVGSAPLPWAGFRLEGSYTEWTETGDRPYLPLREGRGALVFHDLFYLGNLEPTLRLEAQHRGSSLVREAGTRTFTAVAQPYTLFNAYLQIRVIDVRAFLVWENVLNLQTAADLPGAPLGPRVHYGVHWVFRN